MNRPDRTEAKAEFFKLVEEGLSVAAAARQVGVHSTVGYYWVKKRNPFKLDVYLTGSLDG